jgi:predicted secreted Zn-dependent protease
MMRITHVLATLLLVSLATPAAAHGQSHKNLARTQTYAIEGHEIVAPPWSAAYMTDHGPSECGEPMWIYGGRMRTRDAEVHSDVQS